MKGSGRKDARVMIIGEAPGFNEDEQGTPFIGQAGQFLEQCLKEVGIDREDCYITNAVKCRPPANRPPTKTEINACKDHLLNEVLKVNPEYIVTLGNVPLSSVTGKSGIMKYRGSLIEDKSVKVFPMLHPAGILRNPKNIPLMKSDMNRLAQILNGESQELKEYKVKVINNWAQLKMLKRKLKGKKYIAYDLETQSLNWRTAKIWVLGIAISSTKAYIIPIEHPQSPFREDWFGVFTYLWEIFEDKDKFLIAQNGKFDNKFFRREGMEPFLNFDTMIAAHLLDENTPNNLGYLSMSELGTDDYKKRYSMKFDPPSPLSKMAKYCGEDCCNTFGVYRIQKKKLAEDSRLENLFYNLKMPASRLFEKVEMQGIWVDRKKLNKNGKLIHKNVRKLEKTLNKYIPKNFPHNEKIYKTKRGLDKALGECKYGDSPSWYETGGEYHILLPFNWGSTQQVGKLLYLPKREGGWGLHPPNIKEATTGTGANATGEPVLVHLREQHEAIKLLIEYKGWRQLYNSFILSWQKSLDPETDRLYPTFKLTGTVTHRLSSENPNPQQTPRNILIRGNVGAPEGKLFLESDYSQIELRIAAFISGCPVMTRAFQCGEDIHTKTATMLSGRDLSKVSADELKDLRKKAKPVNFGFLYGMWWKTFMQYAFQNYGVHFTEHEAEDVRERFFKTYSGLTPWHKRQIRMAKKLGYVRYPDGTIRRVPDIYSTDKMVSREAEKQAINSPVQGFASNICLLSAIILDKIIDWKTIKIVLSMHDALMFEIDEDMVEHWLPIIKDVMENPPLKELFGVDMTIPIIVDIKVGKYWGELKEWIGKK
jgi:DNA polymerase-1